MSSPAGTTRSPVPVFAWPCLAAALYLLLAVVFSYDRQNGFTGLLRFGETFSVTRLPEVAAANPRIFGGNGYDGQFYAQLAVEPDPREPAVQVALDNPRYRARRILLPAVVHVLGFGHVGPTLNLFALANAACWFALGWLLWRRVAPLGWPGAGVWLGCMLGMGVLDSVRLSLTDLPAMLLVFLGVGLAERGSRLGTVGALAAAALTRETALLAAAGTSAGDLRKRPTRLRLAANAALVVLPLALWVWWLAGHVPAGTTVGNEAHFAAPFAGWLRQVATCLREIAMGNLDSRYTFGLLAALSLAWQAAVVLRTLSLDPPLWARVGAPFALLVFLIGDPVWSGYWAAARTCLPLTFAFNLLLPRGRWFWPQLAFGNICVLHAVVRLWPD